MIFSPRVPPRYTCARRRRRARRPPLIGADRSLDQIGERLRPAGTRRRRRQPTPRGRPYGEAHDRARAAGLAAADLDGDAPHGRHVHAEPCGRAGDERELRRERDLPEGRGALGEGPRDEDVHAERGDDEDGEPHDVLAGAGEDRQLVTDALAAAQAEGTGQAGGGFAGRAGSAGRSCRFAHRRPVSRTHEPAPGWLRSTGAEPSRTQHESGSEGVRSRDVVNDLTTRTRQTSDDRHRTNPSGSRTGPALVDVPEPAEPLFYLGRLGLGQFGVRLGGSLFLRGDEVHVLRLGPCLRRDHPPDGPTGEPNDGGRRVSHILRS